MDTARPIDPLLSRKDAAAYLGIKEATLANWACTGKFKLPFFKVGHFTRYRQSDLDAFPTRGDK